MHRPKYKPWIRSKAVAIFGVLTLVTIVLSFFAFINLIFLLFIVPAVVFCYIFLIVGMSRLWFSRIGGDYQSKIHSLIVSRIVGTRILDIGCGSGHLLSKIAKTKPESELVGIDYWGDDWEYSKELCIGNFKAENITNKVEFRKETASNLPNDLGNFDCIVSCLTFHEVKDVEDKTISINEALRHLNKGGKFIFLDLFRDNKYYTVYKQIEEAIKNSQCTITEKLGLSDILNLPFPLKHTKVLGNAELIVGIKT